MRGFDDTTSPIFYQIYLSNKTTKQQNKTNNNLIYTIMKAQKLTQKELRKMFFEVFPQFKNEFRTRKRQNDYSCDCRCTFVDWMDSLHKDGQLTDKQAQKYTL